MCSYADYENFKQELTRKGNLLYIFIDLAIKAYLRKIFPTQVWRHTHVVIILNLKGHKNSKRYVSSSEIGSQP